MCWEMACPWLEVKVTGHDMKNYRTRHKMLLKKQATKLPKVTDSVVKDGQVFQWQRGVIGNPIHDTR